jgi:ribosome-binding protein aMBF1 (putative translation factor)
MGVLLGQLMRRDRELAGLSIEDASWRVGLTPRRLRDMEAGEVWPDFETYERICELFGWPQSYVRATGRGRGAGG